MKEYPKFSVLMSVYVKENPAYLRLALDSVINQTVKPSEIILVEDGALTDELYLEINDFKNCNPNLLVEIPLKQNVGLGLALAEGILHCSNELVARMDSDDISVRTRFERQINEFIDNPKLDICGGHIIEFINSPDEVFGNRNVPLSHDEIVKYQKKRSAFNHVTVMFKKSAVLKAGNYQHAPLMEDDLLWANMFNSGAYSMNIDDNLVFVRVGAGMIERRGGFKYFLKYRNARKQILDTGFISYFDYVLVNAIQLVVTLIPNKLRAFVFEKLLRN